MRQVEDDEHDRRRADQAHQRRRVLRQQPGQHELQQDEEGERQPDQRGQPAQPRDQPDDDGEGDRQDDDRGVRARSRRSRTAAPPSAPASRVSTSVSPSATPSATTSGGELDLLEVPGALAVEDLHDGGRAGLRDARGRRRSRTPRPRRPGRRGRSCPAAGTSAAACSARVGSPLGPQDEQPDDGGQADRDEQQQHQPDRPPAAGRAPPGSAAVRRGRVRGCGSGWAAPGQARRPAAAAVPDTGGSSRGLPSGPPVSRGAVLARASTIGKRCHRPLSCSGRDTAADGVTSATSIAAWARSCAAAAPARPSRRSS